MIKDEIEKLIQLQNIDNQIREIKEEISSFPEKINGLKKKLEEKKKDLDNLRQEHKKLKLQRREKEGELEAVEEEIKKLKKALNEVKTNKEYNALLKEINDHTGKVSEIEEEIIIMMEKDDEFERKEKTFLEELEKEKERFKVEEEKEKKRIEELNQQLKVKEEERKKIVQQINPGIYQLYEKIRKNKRDGVAICKLEGEPGKESCGGCFVFVPTYIVEKVKKKKEIVQCENCSRILY